MSCDGTSCPYPGDLPAHWAVTGAVAALSSLVAVVTLLVTLPALFPGVYGTLSIGSDAGLLYVFLVAAVLVGTGTVALRKIL